MNIGVLKFIARVLSFGIKICRVFKTIVTKIVLAIRGVIYNIKRHLRKKTDKQTRKVLSNDYLYFVLKLAQVYSRNGKAVAVDKVYSMKEFCDEYKQQYVVIEKAHDEPVCIPRYYGTSEEKIEYHTTKDVYISELQEATVCGASSIILCQKQYIYDPVAFDLEDRLDVKFSDYIAKLNGKIYFQKEEANRSIEKAIFLLGFASYNYYHLTIEILSRMRYIDECEEYDDFPLLVDEVVGRIPQYRELLKRINQKNRNILYVDQNERIYVEKLIYPAYNTWMPINVKRREEIKTSDFVMSNTGLCNIRRAVKLENKEKNKKIFVSRENVMASRLDNEKRVRELFKENGYEIVQTEKMSFDEQVEYFNSAKCVVAASGAALTNIVYCQPGTTICCIIPSEYNFYAYSTMAYLLGLMPVFLDAKISERTAYSAMDMFHIDLEKCEEFIAEYSK